MRIETRPSEELPHVAHLDETEARVLSRCLDAVIAWMAGRPEALRGRLAGGHGSLRAAFPDEGSLGAFLGLFLPGRILAAA